MAREPACIIRRGRTRAGAERGLDRVSASGEHAARERSGPASGRGSLGSGAASARAVCSSGNAGTAAAQAEKGRFAVKLAGGAFYQRLFAVQSYGGEGYIGAGFSSDDYAVSVSLHMARGQTFHGLALASTRIQSTIEWIFGRWRVGLGPCAGYLSVDRATTGGSVDDDTLPELYIGGELHGSVDLIPLPHRSAIFLEAALKDEGVTVWGPLLLLGVRIESDPAARSRSSSDGVRAGEPSGTAR